MSNTYPHEDPQSHNQKHSTTRHATKPNFIIRVHIQVFAPLPKRIGRKYSAPAPAGGTSTVITHDFCVWIAQVSEIRLMIFLIILSLSADIRRCCIQAAEAEDWAAATQCALAIVMRSIMSMNTCIQQRHGHAIFVMHGSIPGKYWQCIVSDRMPDCSLQDLL